MMMLVPLLIFLGDHGLMYHQKNKILLKKMTDSNITYLLLTLHKFFKHCFAIFVVRI